MGAFALRFKSRGWAIAAARRFGIDPRTVGKMVRFTAPPGYVRTKPPAKPKLDPFIPMIDWIPFDDKSRLNWTPFVGPRDVGFKV